MDHTQDGQSSHHNIQIPEPGYSTPGSGKVLGFGHPSINLANQDREDPASSQQTHDPEPGSSNEDKTRLDASGDASSLPARPRPRTKSDTVVIPNAGRLISMQIAKKTGKSSDIASYKEWLAGKSKDDLVEMLMGMSTDVPEVDNTDKIAAVKTADTGAEAESYVVPQNLLYQRLPALRKVPFAEQVPAWHIVLVSLDQTHEPVGLLIDGEITVGRAVGDASPDLDLAGFDAKRKGVSRIHARLCPTLEALMLLDEDSSNGTYWNRLRLPGGTPQPLKDGDVIAFGRANFLLRIIKAPSAREPRTLI